MQYEWALSCSNITASVSAALQHASRNTSSTLSAPRDVSSGRSMSFLSSCHISLLLCQAPDPSHPPWGARTESPVSVSFVLFLYEILIIVACFTECEAVWSLLPVYSWIMMLRSVDFISFLFNSSLLRLREYRKFLQSLRRGLKALLRCFCLWIVQSFMQSL